MFNSELRVPNWDKSMPKSVCKINIQWSYVYHILEENLGRPPTKSETKSVISKIRKTEWKKLEIKCLDEVAKSIKKTAKSMKE